MFLKSTGKRGLFDEQEAIDLMSEMGNSLDSWTKKGGDTFYGYKNHAKVDTKSKLIDYYVVTDASVHDSQPLMLVDRWIEFAQRVWILELFDLTLRSDRRFSLGRYGFLS